MWRLESGGILHFDAHAMDNNLNKMMLSSRERCKMTVWQSFQHTTPIMLSAAHVLLLLPVAVLGIPGLIVQHPQLQNPMDDVKVPVQLGVMSRCPDALLCESIFDRVLKKVSDKVDLAFFFIAKCAASHSRLPCAHSL
jgi:hypothetical protein